MPAAVSEYGVEPIGVYRAISKPSEHRGLAFPVRGRVSKVLVEPGQSVVTGEDLIKLEDQLEAAAVQIAEIRASDDTEVENAEQLVAFREEELRLTMQSNTGGGASGADLREARFSYDRALIDLRAAHIARAEARSALAREQIRLAELTIKAPFDGQVLDVSKKEGEGVDELTAVVTLVDVDTLLLELNVPPLDALRIRKGMRAVVEWEDVPDLELTEGVVKLRAAAGHAGARLIPVRVEARNPGGLPSGLHARVTILPEDARLPLKSAAGAESASGRALTRRTP